MKLKEMSRSHLFLIELIIIILFFAFASAISIQVFAKAHEIADRSTALNGAMMAVQSAAESDRSTALKDLSFSDAEKYFNKDWEEVSSSDANYILTTKTSKESKTAGTMVIFHYSVTSGNEVVFQLQSKKYYPDGPVSADAQSEVN